VIAWYDPGLQVPSDPPRRASYRALQSWYRETVLGVEPGWHPSGRLLGSLLPKPRELDGLNFLDAQIAGYAKRRAWQVQQDGGTLEVGRLRRNMLSSMPLCFNLFGKLHAERSAAAKALSALLGLDIADIDEVLVEHAPPAAKQLLGDRTAFDAFLTYTTATGAKGLWAWRPSTPSRSAEAGPSPTSCGATRCWRRQPGKPAATSSAMRW
jgi:hypothetical protein